MSVTARFQKAIGVLLKHTLNPLTRRLARGRFGPFALVRHVGRKSGRPYETPLIVARAGDDIVIELTYGAQVDWYKNVQAAGGCTLLWHRREYLIDRLAPLPAAAGRAAYPAPARVILRLLNRQHFVRMHVAAVRPA
jgi:deazaflavin-dependent oxidoreductase (nitroreductase family)